MLFLLGAALFASDAEVQARLAEMPHRPGGERVSAVLDTGGGILTSETVAHGGFGARRGWAVTIYSWVAGWGFDRGLIVHATNEVELGFGNTDARPTFQGALGLGLFGGYRPRVFPDHGPFVRAGVFARMSGNDVFYRSILEIPEVHVGWQYLRGRRTLVDLAWTAGFVLTGRDDKMPGTRKLDVTLSTGAIASFSIGPLVLLGRYLHVVSRDAGGGVHWADAMLCGNIAEKYALCARGVFDLGDVLDRDGLFIGAGRAAQVGFLLGMKQDLRKSGVY